MLKKEIVLKKILKWLLFILVFFILGEYAYSQRWRLQKEIPVKDYDKHIEGGWVYNEEVGLGIFMKDSFLRERNYWKFHPFAWSYKTATWKLKGNLLVIKRKIYPDVSDSSIKSETEGKPFFMMNEVREVFFLSKNFLVFDEKDTSVKFPRIPRKRVYRDRAK